MGIQFEPIAGLKKKGRAKTDRQAAKALQVELAAKASGLQAVETVLEELGAEIDGCGGYRNWADEKDINAEYVRQTRTGARAPAKSILDALGFEAVTMYRRKEKK